MQPIPDENNSGDDKEIECREFHLTSLSITGYFPFASLFINHS